MMSLVLKNWNLNDRPEIQEQAMQTEIRLLCRALGIELYEI